MLLQKLLQKSRDNPLYIGELLRPFLQIIYSLIPHLRFFFLRNISATS